MRRLLVAALLGALNRLAADTAARVGGGLGVIAWRLGVRRRVVNDIIARALALDPVARRRVTRRAYATMGANFIEVWTIGGPDGPERHLRLLTPRWQQRIHAQGRALAYVGPHLGAWDVGGHGIVGPARRLLVYAKAQHSPEVDRLVNMQRERLGYRVLLTQHGDRTGAVTVLRSLREGASVALMGDQRPGDHEAAPAWFLGQRANCHLGPGFFAGRAGVSLVPSFCVRVRAGESALFVGRPLAPRPGLDLTQAVMDWYSAMIAAFPGQYFWHHRRFSGTAPELVPRSGEPWRERGLRVLVDEVVEGGVGDDGRRKTKD